MKKISLFVLLTLLSFAINFIGCKTEVENEKVVSLESIYISKQPNKTAYDFNSVLDFTGIEIKGKYSDGTEKIIDGWSSNPKQGEKLTTKGEIKIVITYEGHSASFCIVVTEKILSSIYISKQPDKLDYNYNSVLDLSGLEVKGVYKDGSEEIINGWTAEPREGDKLTTAGTVTVIISYGNKTTSFDISVSKKLLSSIYISKLPDKLNYEYNSMLDLTGLEVKGKYNDDSEDVINNWISEPKAWSDLDKSGTITVRISCEDKVTNFEINVSNKPDIISDEFFWGTWVEMYSGEEFEILETSVRTYRRYNVTASDNRTLTLDSFGTFTKESDNVIWCNNTPYFRKGCVNPKYSLKIIDLRNSSSSTESTNTSISSIRGKSKSIKYNNFESISEIDSDGYLRFTAPTINDIQTVEIFDGNETIIIPGLNICNSNDYMGTVALVSKGDYNLKITGTISNDQKYNGYLFGNNAKSYNMLFTITNISENFCPSVNCTIESDNKNLKIESTDGTDISNFTIQTLAGGSAKDINLSVEYGDLTEPYVDTGIIVTIKNPITEQEWKDYIPLRFFKGVIPITIIANANYELLGIVKYPDSNNQFFVIPHTRNLDYHYKLIFIPTFGDSKPYMFAFKGLGKQNTYKYIYTVAPSTLSIHPITTITDSDILLDSLLNNHTEDSAYTVMDKFQAYLSEGEIDYYNITIDSDTFYIPDGNDYYSINFVNEKGDVPNAFLITKNSDLSQIQLPDMVCENYNFLGWYAGDRKITSNKSFYISESTILTAKWEPEKYPITYKLNGGTNSSTNPLSYTIESDLITFEAPKRTGYDFDGWFSNEDFSGNIVENIAGGTTGEITLYAKWTPTILFGAGEKSHLAPIGKSQF